MGKGLLPGAIAFLVFIIAPTLSPTAVRAADDPKPYKIENGNVDQGTYNGYRRYGKSCMRCHGPDGAGSSYAPALTELPEASRP